MEWKRNKPETPGFYLLYDPKLKTIYCHNVFSLNEKLLMLDSNSILQKIDSIQDHLWYGPIQPPGEVDATT